MLMSGEVNGGEWHLAVGRGRVCQQVLTVELEVTAEVEAVAMGVGIRQTL